ncbi:MAG: hypothetical protein AAF492_18385, partial [Verrucomicrobiota bacterium]
VDGDGDLDVVVGYYASGLPYYGVFYNTGCHSDPAPRLIAEPSVVEDDSNLVYHVSVSNRGDIVSTGVVVTDTVPAHLTFDVEMSWSNAFMSNDAVVMHLDPILPQSTVVHPLGFRVSPTVGALITNSVLVRADNETNLTNNLAFVITPVLDSDADTDPDFSDFDDDNDGAPDEEEAAADTDPRNPSSVLRFLSIGVTGSVTRVQWQGGRLATQFLEKAMALSPADMDWQVVFTNDPPTSMTNIYLDPDISTNQRAYYRIRIETDSPLNK